MSTPESVDPPIIVAVAHPDAPDPTPFVAGGVTVTVTAHYDDEAADECHYADWPEGIGPSPTPSSTVDERRRPYR